MSLEHHPAKQRRPGIGHNNGPAFGIDDLKVLSRKQLAALLGLSFGTTKRLLDSGRGPAVVQLTQRRVGVRVGDARRWMDSRIRDAS